MELVRGRHNLQARHRGCTLTIGNFDGVHLGHRSVIAQLIERARARDLPACVMTFEPHPREWFDPDHAPARLSRLRDKLAGLRALGVDRVLLLRFDAQLTKLAPQAFVDELLVTALEVRHVVVGDDFRFGHRREGDFGTLRIAGKAAGFDVESAATRELDGERVSSTRVRRALAAGDLETAERLLGGRYAIHGRVIHGDKLGHQLGYPTANIALDRYRLPLTGVFAVLAWDASGRRLPGVANLGWRPTVGGTRPLLEVHVFDFDGDLYGAHLRVELLRHLRPEARFDSLEAMTERMHEDARIARTVVDRISDMPTARRAEQEQASSDE